MVDVPLLNEYFTVLLAVFGGGVGIMMKVRSQDINRIERRIDDVIKCLNQNTQIQNQHLAEINASLKIIVEFMKNKR
jgi:ubiquinone biosynthesis protein COQ9